MYWLEWDVEYLENEQCFQSSDYQIIQQNHERIVLPLSYIQDLAQKLDLLAILRTPSHIPRDPYELVKFINSIRAST